MRPDNQQRWSPAETPGSEPASQPDPGNTLHPPRTSRVWWWIVAAFALQLAAWITWFVIASQHRVAEVPLTTNATGDKR